MVRRARALTRTAPARPLFYTAQDLAHFCEVDLKTVHHWADRNAIAHHRTSGRHLRFRRNDVVRFLRLYGYCVPSSVQRARCLVAFALPSDEIAKKLTSRFDLARFDSAMSALACLFEHEPDAIVVSLADDTFAGARSVAALKADPKTAWVLVAAIGDGDALEAARAAGAEIALATDDVARLGAELSRALATGK